MSRLRGRLKSLGRPAVTAGLFPTGIQCLIGAGERPWFLTTVGGPGGGTITWNNTTITIPAGVFFTRGGDDWPQDCEDWHTQWQVVFNSTLGETFFEWGPM